MIYPIYLGQRSDIPESISNPPLYLKQGESIDFSLSPQYEEIKQFIEHRQPIESIDQITVRMDEIMFEDGTRYAQGEIYRRNPDPNSPNKWILVSGVQ